ncbi:hypothetical protein IQ249_17470 [Lusitaniella coriacea LEGE 07157]|uniref:Uncharacterized protein n=1 Tax=Lusitaniella coriacea LEGE 07157 TaxID=945747 RepID=A0A8J7E2N1_9CYAN|nr:hypothetical protein [Lusitaniella coriacea]MBE9117689.1 hypothetical protein [Lusitaniella coriacea LEGE 07157]
MKQLNSHSIFGRVAKFGGTALLSISMLAFAACKPTPEEVEVDAPAPEEVETDAPVPTEQSAVPEEAEAGGGDSDVNDLIGETITVSTKVTERLTPNLFTIYDVESLRGEEILAITDLPIPESGSNIEVTGEVMEIDEAAIKSAYNVTLDPEVVEAYAGKPYLAVKAIESVD